MSKVVYLIEQPLDGRNHDRFGIETWNARGWPVEVWDLTPLAHPRAWEDFIASGRALSGFAGYFSVASKGQLDIRCSSVGRVEYFVDLSGDSYYAVRAKMRLMRRGAIRVVCTAGSIPDMFDANQKHGFVRKLMKTLAQGPIKSFNMLGNALVARLAAPFISPGLSVVSGEESLRSSLDTGHQHEILKAHNLDYDIFLRLRKSTVAQPGGHCVFLDQNICFAPDFIYENVAPYATSEKYFPTVCNGLRRISDILSVTVRIAAHPRLPPRKEYPDYFRGMSMEYGKTAELISNCRFVVCHYSTAIQFAVLFNKPVIFVTTDQLRRTPAEKFIARFASALGKSVINLDGDLSGVDWQRELLIDSRLYDAYRNAYIKVDGSPDIPYWDIVVDHIEKVRARRTAELVNERGYVAGGR